MIKKIVIPAAGLGMRLLPITKEIPKEMMPLFLKENNSEIVVKPLIQIIFEKFFHFGVKEFCIIVGRQKRTIEDHFTLDQDFLKNLDPNSKFRKDLEEFYSMLSNSKIFWINQQKPKGFGDAVLYAESFVGDEDFLVSAGDTLIPDNDTMIHELLKTKLGGKNDAMLVLKKVSDPQRFGVAVVKQAEGKIFVTNVEEKPSSPKSDLSLVALYHFRPSIFEALKEITDGKKEVQLTDGIQKLIEWGGKINAIVMNKNDVVIDIGTAESYLENIWKFKEP